MVRTMYGGFDFKNSNKNSNKNSESNKNADNRKNIQKNRGKAKRYLSDLPPTELSDNIPAASSESVVAMRKAKEKAGKYGMPRSMLFDIAGGGRRRKKRRKSHKRTKRISNSRKRTRKRKRKRTRRRR